MSGLSGTKRGQRRKTARRAYEGLGSTKKEREYLWASGVAGLDGTHRHCTKFQKKPRKVCVKYDPGPGSDPSPGSKGIRHCSKKVTRKVNTCVKYKTGAGKPRGYPKGTKKKAATKKRSANGRRKDGPKTTSGRCKFGKVKSGVRKGKCRMYKVRTKKAGNGAKRAVTAAVRAGRRADASSAMERRRSTRPGYARMDLNGLRRR